MSLFSCLILFQRSASESEIEFPKELNSVARAIVPAETVIGGLVGNTAGDGEMRAYVYSLLLNIPI